MACALKHIITKSNKKTIQYWNYIYNLMTNRIFHHRINRDCHRYKVCDEAKNQKRFVAFILPFIEFVLSICYILCRLCQIPKKDKNFGFTRMRREVCNFLYFYASLWFPLNNSGLLLTFTPIFVDKFTFFSQHKPSG